MLHRRLALALVLPCLVWGGVITENITFSRDDLSISKIDNYDLVTLNGHPSTWERARPLLPVVTLSFLIPPTAEVTKVEVVASESQVLPGEYLPHPAQTIRPFSSKNVYPFVEPDQEVYGSSAPYPAEIATLIPSGSLSGYRIAGVLVNPVQFLPAERHLRLYTSITLRLHYETGRHQEVFLTASQQELFGREVKELVVNAREITAWAPRIHELDAGEVDYVIITSRTLVPSWDAFKDWKTKKGLNTVVMGTDSIYARYPGRDNQEKIRNFITDYWRTKGLKYVLLGGDDMIVPDRKTRLVIEESTITGSIPTDMYYADLQWSWDGNRNSFFGEMQDTVDLLHDVYIGRAPIDNATNLSTFIRKDTTFEKYPDTAYMKSLLLPSQMLFSPYHGEFPNNIIASYFPANWKKAKLKDPLSTATRDSLNRGYQFCHIAAHGSSTSLSVLSMTHIPTLTNGMRLDIMNAINCDVGSFDAKDCIAESLVNCPTGGCVANMLNSRYGLGYPPGLGPSEILDLEFFKCFWLKSAFEVGIAHDMSKNNCRNMAMSQAATRWCVYENTLFGEPNVPAYSVAPRRPTVTHAATIPASPQMLRVTAILSGTPVVNALVCAMKGTEVYSVGRTNSQGWIDLFVNPTTTGSLSITVTYKDLVPYEGTCAVTSGSPRPCIVYQSHRIDDSGGNNNGRLDPGETVNFYMTLKNAGNSGATNLQGRLRNSSGFISFIDSTAVYGSVAAGDTSRGDAYRFVVAPSTPQGTGIEFLVNATASEGTWEPLLTLFVGVAPDARLAWADHDTCLPAFTVTTNGSFGVTYPYGEGSGFKYSKLSSYGNLQYASMLAGTDANYVVDRFYGRPYTTINQDFRVVDSLRPVLPPRAAQEEYEAVYNDANHSSPRGLEIDQWSLSLSQPGYDDWVIVCFDYYNRGTSPINNLYSGMMFDFDVYNNVTSNVVRSDSLRRFVYMRRSTTMYPVCGLRVLQPRAARNLAAIDHARYVLPATMMTEAVKDSFLSGAIRMRTSDRAYNWSICASAGPFNLPVGGKWRVAYAIVGGTDTTLALVNSDSAQSWWDRNVSIEEETYARISDLPAVDITPNPFYKTVNISYSLPTREKLTIDVFDASGRLVDNLFRGETQGKGRIHWRPLGLPNGVYFVKIDKASGSSVAKIVHLE